MKNILFVFVLIASLLILFSTTLANSVTLTKLENIPDGEFALCKVKSNNFVFTCILNTKNYYNCKFVIGSKFTLPNCKPCDCAKSAPKIKKTTGNPFLDAVRKY